MGHNDTWPSIGIVIVTYNSAAEIGPCLDAALATGAEVVVVDNASSDGTIAEVARRGARLIANPDNRGFAAAVNQGFRALNCPYRSVVESRRGYANRPRIVARSMRISRARQGLADFCSMSGGIPQIGFMVRRFPTPAALILEALLLNRIWPNNPVNRRYRALDLNDR